MAIGNGPWVIYKKSCESFATLLFSITYNL